MKTSLEQELESLQTCYGEWGNVLYRHFRLIYESDDEDDLDEHIQVATQVHNIFETILRLFTTHGQIRDTWVFSTQLDVFPFGQQCSVRSQKMGVDFDFGIYHSYFFLHSYLRYASYIKNMDDQFWSNFVDLQSLGQFEFMENALPSSGEGKSAMKGLKNTKSNIFQLIRNYIVLELHDGGAGDLGSLEIKWPVTPSWEGMIRNAASAFTGLYRINYILYRVEYLREKGMKRRAK